MSYDLNVARITFLENVILSKLTRSMWYTQGPAKKVFSDKHVSDNDIRIARRRVKTYLTYPERLEETYEIFKKQKLSLIMEVLLDTMLILDILEQI